MSAAYIVTGTTRGIGQALAEEIALRGHMLFCISRAPEMQTGGRRNYMCDLRDPGETSKVMSRLMNDVPHASCSDVVLVNNAGTLAPIGFLENHTPVQMSDPMQVNLMAPAVLISSFIRESDRWGASRRIINITSGAALHPYAGWSLYCAAKAALNMLTRCAALEQEIRPNGVSICAVAPGVVNTGMQALIREAKDTDFPARARFLKMRQEGRLAEPAKVAALILDLDAGGKFQPGGIYDLRRVEWKEGKPHIEAMVI
ncbi:MAG: SDR family NAD(P)-dependent oxidoreductase [Desulfobacteraceae bacterium]|nr:MAG: SDR family NAD(P)-dependent oxidoreductase [Desulfobacteraceae bacterium]